MRLIKKEFSLSSQNIIVSRFSVKITNVTSLCSPHHFWGQQLALVLCFYRALSFQVFNFSAKKRMQNLKWISSTASFQGCPFQSSPSTLTWLAACLEYVLCAIHIITLMSYISHVSSEPLRILLKQFRLSLWITFEPILYSMPHWVISQAKNILFSANNIFLTMMLN